MPVTVRCPNPSCGKRAGVAEDALGRLGRCPRCGRTFLLTPADEASTQGTVDQRAAQSMNNAKLAPDRSIADPATPANTDLPRRIGRFQVRARLGAGAFGTVYRAYDPQRDRGWR